MPDLDSILEHLRRTRSVLLSALDSVPAELWRTRPRSGAWSAAEVTAHLLMVETAIIDAAGRMVQKPPTPTPVWKRAHLSPRFAAWRIVRRKTPIPLDESLLATKTVMQTRLSSLRERTLALIEETRGRDLRLYRWPHPFFGSLNLYGWFRVIGHHEVRHTKQVREILQTLGRT